ncbi:hypothetical protein LOK49_LG06G02798 [Camellia lanceoleosa]|uniref:Uncharacterized protein n=1 Tax=Camellia lanceoleosa TaxID=1840588 RepID=A0ACC0HAV8_9ERIC|nr:hypothetical protein LOK49_LG06G02798 [Camellia lanceoleosa]
MAIRSLEHLLRLNCRGLVHLGKGLLTLAPYHYGAFAIPPRMLLTVDENLKPLSVPVRVGQAVDVVGQAGRPKTITGF